MPDLSQRFGFLVNEVGRLYGRYFDQLARDRVGLSRAQCRLLAAIASQPPLRPWTQTDLAHRLDLTPMGVASLLRRMEKAGWLERQDNPADRRSYLICLRQKARGAIEEAIATGDAAQDQVLAGLDSHERVLFMALLLRVQANLQDLVAR